MKQKVTPIKLIILILLIIILIIEIILIVRIKTDKKNSITNSFPIIENTTTEPQISSSSTSDTNSWFSQNGFALSPCEEDFCIINDSKHVCNVKSELKISQSNDNCNAGMKCVTASYNTFCNCLSNYTLLMFDKYTGTSLNNYWSDYYTFDYNGKTVMFRGCKSGGGGTEEAIVECSEDYDGIIFVLCPVEKIKGFPNELCSIEDIIDFSGGDCYFFSLTNN